MIKHIGKSFGVEILGASASFEKKSIHFFYYNMFTNIGNTIFCTEKKHQAAGIEMDRVFWWIQLQGFRFAQH